mgnify:CR=1 FL=1
MKFIDKDLKAVQEARVLMEEAAEAKKTLALFEQKKLNRIAACMMDALELKLVTAHRRGGSGNGIRRRKGSAASGKAPDQENAENSGTYVNA